MFNVMNAARNSQGKAGVTVVNGADFVTNFDPGLARPYLAEDGKIYVDVTTDFEPRVDNEGNYVTNAAGHVVYDRVVEPQLVSDRVRHNLPVLDVDNATVLRKDQWIKVDAAVGTAARKPLKFYGDMRAVNTNTLDGMSIGTLEREIITDDGEAVVSMDGLAEARNSQSSLGLESIPLPITHSAFFMSQRFLQISRNKGQGLDLTRGEQSARRCGEMVEKTAIGTETGITWGTDSSAHLNDSEVYGATNHPNRITYTSLTASATIATNIASTGPFSFLSGVDAMINAAYDQNFYGPYVLYLSTAYHNLIRRDFLISGSLSSRTIRDRILEIDTITDVRRLDFLTGDVMLLIQMDSQYLEGVNGMEFTTVQYGTKGDMQQNFMVMGIQVPRFKPVYISNPGSAPSAKIPVVHGTTA